MYSIINLPHGFHLQKIAFNNEQMTIFLTTTAPAATCPVCGGVSQRVHSRYQRRLHDLPCFDRSVQLFITCRRFFCSVIGCPRKIFAERITELTSPYAHSTGRLDTAHRHIAFVLGGEPGARLAGQLHMPISPDTLLRRIRQTELPATAPVRVVGVDDWALRKGQRYGTIVCDLERRQPIDLLPTRSSEALANWLQEHSQVEIVSRDRGDDYIKGASEGAPDARQVADRWHLLKNVGEA